MKIQEPKHKIGDIVYVSEPEMDEGRVFQGVIESAELIGETSECWFYGIRVPQASVDGEDIKVFSYEGDCGDAKSKLCENKEEPVKLPY